MNKILILVMFCNLLFSTIGDYLAKLWGITNNNVYLYIAMVVSVLTSYFYLSTVKMSGLTIGPSILLILTLIISVSMGYFIFQEKISATQLTGIILGFVSIILILDIVKI